MEKKYLLSIAALSLFASADAARGGRDNCEPTPPACYPADCNRCYCLGPDNYGANAPVNPKTCDGDWTITLAGFYWNAHQDGMEYAIDNRVRNPNVNPVMVLAPNIPDSVLELNNLIDAEYLTPNYSWDFGFKAGIGYATTCDGWDFGVLWTHFHDGATDHVEANVDDNHTLLPLWSAFSSGLGSVLYATDIRTNWKLKLDLVDIELGRNFWTSRLVSIRPHVGLRVALIKQNYEIDHSGGSWSAIISNTIGDIAQPAFNNRVDLSNDYRGIGLRSGLDSFWNFGCGWALYGNLAASIIYGRFKVDHDEQNRLAANPHPKTKILETHESFRASRAMLDLALGVQWSGMFCDCKYGITVALGWEHHLLFDQNQMWRVNRIGDVSSAIAGGTSLPNLTGENVYHQRRGDLDTQGWTFTVKFDF